MTRSGKKSSANNARPERIGLPESGGKIEHLKFAAAGGQAVNGVPAARNQMQNGEQSNQRPTNVDPGLHHVGPDHRRKPALEGVDQSQGSDDGDGSNLSCAQSNGHNDRNGIHTHAFGSSPCEQKQACSE